jgi:hypothetical protein
MEKQQQEIIISTESWVYRLINDTRKLIATEWICKDIESIREMENMILT